MFAAGCRAGGSAAAGLLPPLPPRSRLLLLHLLLHLLLLLLLLLEPRPDEPEVLLALGRRGAGHHRSDPLPAQLAWLAGHAGVGLQRRLELRVLRGLPQPPHLHGPLLLLLGEGQLHEGAGSGAVSTQLRPPLLAALRPG